jgi:hypothetical protein
MSKVTSDSSDEQASRAWEFMEEIYTKLAQARGICGLFVMMNPATIQDQISNAMSAAEDLIEAAQKGLDELRDVKR